MEQRAGYDSLAEMLARSSQGTMAGHGHVVPNKDGSLARCGGPKLCSVCAMEFAQLNYKPHKPDASIDGTGWAEAAFQ